MGLHLNVWNKSKEHGYCDINTAIEHTYKFYHFDELGENNYFNFLSKHSKRIGNMYDWDETFELSYEDFKEFLEIYYCACNFFNIPYDYFDKELQEHILNNKSPKILEWR